MRLYELGLVKRKGENMYKTYIGPTVKKRNGNDNERRLPKITLATFVERYFDCPKCGNLITDHGTADGFDLGNDIKCPDCDNWFYVEGLCD